VTSLVTTSVFCRFVLSNFPPCLKVSPSPRLSFGFADAKFLEVFVFSFFFWQCGRRFLFPTVFVPLNCPPSPSNPTRFKLAPLCIDHRLSFFLSPLSRPVRLPLKDPRFQFLTPPFCHPGQFSLVFSVFRLDPSPFPFPNPITDVWAV